MHCLFGWFFCTLRPSFIDSVWIYLHGLVLKYFKHTKKRSCQVIGSTTRHLINFVYCFFYFRSLLALFIFVTTFSLSSARGRMLEPSQRSSLWRLGFDSPVNRDDNGLNCGGYWVRFIGVTKNTNYWKVTRKERS